MKYEVKSVPIWNVERGEREFVCSIEGPNIRHNVLLGLFNGDIAHQQLVVLCDMLNDAYRMGRQDTQQKMLKALGLRTWAGEVKTI